MRKGQAALEFLTTYGWAFLVILVMIGALAGFGILSPKNLLPNRCNIGPELACEEAQIISGGDLTFVVRNSMTDTININATSISAMFNIIDVTDGAGCTATPTGVAPGTTSVVVCPYTDTNLPAAGDKAKIEVEISFTPAGKTLEQRVKGEIFQLVQE